MGGKRTGIGLVAIVGLLLGYLLFWPVPIDPAAWTPPKAPALTGIYEPNNRLASVERLGAGALAGPEDVAVDDRGRIYAGMKDGRISRIQADGTNLEVFADTKGRPLGLQFDAAGNLVVADAYKGLLSISPDGSIAVLCTEADGVPFRLTDDVDIAKDGTIYFSDASYRFPLDDYLLDAMEHRPNGRLLAYDPATRSVRLVMANLYFANGVAVSPDQSFVLVNESWRYRVQRHWLTGPRQGESEIFIDNLPGIPDGISSDGRDTFWVALVTPRDAATDTMLPRPFLRKMILRLPETLLPETRRYGFVLGLDTKGQVVQNLQDPSGSFAMITNVQEHGGMLYLGSLAENAIGRLPAPSKREN